MLICLYFVLRCLLIFSSLFYKTFRYPCNEYKYRDCLYFQNYFAVVIRTLCVNSETYTAIIVAKATLQLTFSVCPYLGSVTSRLLLAIFCCFWGQQKQGCNFYDFHFIFCRKLSMIRYMCLQYGTEPILIQQKLFGVRSILKRTLWHLV